MPVGRIYTNTGDHEIYTSTDSDAEMASAPNRQFEQDPSHAMSPGDEDLTTGRGNTMSVFGEVTDETGDRQCFERFK